MYIKEYMMNFKKIIATLLILLLALSLVFLLTPFMARARSLSIMKIYDRYQDHMGIPENEGVMVDLPFDGMDFYPLMVTFNDGAGLSKFIGQSVDFTVEYTFADFPRFKSRSNIYDPSHPLYNAYLGVYYVKGYKSMLSEDTTLGVASYDARHLALPAVGMKRSDAVFEVSNVNTSKQTLEFGERKWTLYAAKINTNSHLHSTGEFSPGDLQFGKSPKTNINYPIIPMEGRLYLTYLEDEDINVCIYVLVKDAKTADQIHEDIILNTTFKIDERP